MLNISLVIKSCMYSFNLTSTQMKCLNCCLFVVFYTEFVVPKERLLSKWRERDVMGDYLV